MVHILARHLRSEFLAVPELVRFDMAHGSDGPEPTLLIKANSLSLKYFLRRESFRFVVSRVGRKIVYAVEIPDDLKQSAMAWSLVEREEELTALKALVANPRSVVFLFNELAVSVSWTEINLPISAEMLQPLESAELHTKVTPEDANLVGDRLDEIRVETKLPDTQVLSFERVVWHELNATYITNKAGRSDLSLFNTDEGGQQEQIAVWLTDSLHPGGCVLSPQVYEKVPRELSDVLLSYPFGVFLIESKSLAILTRDNLPDRQKLKSALTKHVFKASRQLVGGIRNLTNGLVVTDGAGNHLKLERSLPVHAIILVPDLSLLDQATELGAEFFVDFTRSTGGYLHIVDPAELLRIVQVAEIVVDRGQITTRMMGFDWYLLERAKLAITHSTPYFQVLFR